MMKVTEQEKAELKPLVDPLIAKSKEVIRDAFSKYKMEDMAITWTGGKDSGLGLWLTRQVCLEDKIQIPKVMTIDEFDVFQEIHEFMEKYARSFFYSLVMLSTNWKWRAVYIPSIIIIILLASYPLFPWNLFSLLYIPALFYFLYRKIANVLNQK